MAAVVGAACNPKLLLLTAVELAELGSLGLLLLGAFLLQLLSGHP